MVYIRPLISKSFCSWTNPLMTVPSAPVTIGITVIFMFHSFFSILQQGPGTYLSFRFLLILPCCQPERQSPLFGRFSFFLLTITRSGCLAVVICLYLKIPEEFVCFIFLDGFLVVHILFVGRVKFKLLAQFPVDPFALPISSSVILFLCANSMHLLIRWLIVSSLSKESQHLFCCDLFILVLI